MMGHDVTQIATNMQQIRFCAVAVPFSHAHNKCLIVVISIETSTVTCEQPHYRVSVTPLWQIPTMTLCNHVPLKVVLGCNEYLLVQIIDQQLHYQQRNAGTRKYRYSCVAYHNGWTSRRRRTDPHVCGLHCHGSPGAF